MSQNDEKVLTMDKTEVKSSIKIGVYSIYDCVLKQFGAPICIPVSKVNDYFTLLVNDVQSPYYDHESDYILNKIADFDSNTGEIIPCFIERISLLDNFININKRNLQTIIQTLNYLPSGYFKMPSEQKEAIQANIDKAVQKYISDYVVPDMDISSEKVHQLEEKISDYEQRLNVSSK